MRKVLYKSRVSANWDRIPKVVGQVIGKGTEKMKDKLRPYIVVETEDGEVRVYENAGLQDLFKVATVGRHVSIEFLATTTTQKGHAFRQFRSSCWEEEDETAGSPSSPRRSRGGK